MAHQKFDISKLEKLNDPGRFETLRPDAMWTALGAESPDAIVEIGAGTGLFSAEFSRRAPDATVYAADLEPRMIEWMRAHRPEVATGAVVPLLSEESSVPLDDAVADAVFMVNLHHELADPHAIYREAFRLLKPHGKLLVVDWAPIETPKGPPQSIRISAREAAGFLERAGFTGTRIHDGLPWHWLVVARKGGGA